MIDRKRKTTRKIIILILLSILICLALLVLLRNPLAKSILPSIISRQTNNTVSLTIDKVYLGFNGDIRLEKPDFIFQNTFIDMAKSIELEKLSFENINFYSVSIKTLLFNNTLIADSLLINRPDISIKEQIAVEIAGGEKQKPGPELLLKIINEQSGQDIKQKIKLGEIRINYGTLNIDPLAGSESNPEIIDFKIIIENFSTLPADNKMPGRILFADDIQFEISDINKLKLAGYDLDLKSIFFSVRKNKLKISGAKLSPEILSDSINQIALSVQQVEFNGLSINEISGKEEIELSSVRISDGYLVTSSISKQKTGNEVHNKVFQQFADVISQFKLDTLGIHCIDLEFLEYLTDTIGYLDNINLELYGVLIDSSMLDHLFREIVFDEFVYTTGKGGYNLSSENLKIDIDSSSYNSINEKAEFFKLELLDKNKEAGKKITQLTAGRITIDGLSKDPVPYPEMLQLSIKIEDVLGQVDLEHQMFKNGSKGRSNSLLKLDDFDRIQLLNTNLEIYKNDKFSLQIKELETMLNRPLQESDGKLLFNSDSFKMKASGLAFESGKDIIVTSGPLEFENDNFLLENLSFNYITNAGKSNLKLNKFEIKEILLNDLLTNNSFIATAIELDQLKTSGKIEIPVRSQKANDPAAISSGLKIPLEKIVISKLNISNAGIDNTITHSTEDFTIRSKLDIEFNDIILKRPFINKDQLADIKGKVNITETAIEAYGHSLNMDDLLADLSDNSFVANKIKIEYNRDSISINKPVIKNLTLSLFEFENIDYKKLITDKQVQFNTILVKELLVDMIINTERNPGEKDSNKPGFNLQDISDIEYDKLDFENFQIKVEVKNDSANSIVEVRELNLRHDRTEDKEHNIMSDIAFSFSHFSFTGHIKHSRFSIESGVFKRNSNALILNNIAAGNIQSGDIEISNEPGWNYKSSELTVYGLFARNAFPTRLSMDKLVLSDANLLISSKQKANKKSGLKLDIESFRKIGSIMTKLKVDTTVFQDVKLQYRSFDDTSSHTFLTDSIGIVINDINIDTTVFENNDQDIIKKMSIDFKGHTHITKDSLYEMRSGIVSYEFDKNIITIDSFQLVPRYDETEFFKKAVYQTDRMALFGRRFELHDFKMDELFQDDLIHFGRIDIDSIYLDMTRDKRYPRKPDDFKKMPTEMLRSLDQKISIDSIKVKNSFVRYSEYVEKSDLPGTVYFSRFNANVFNLSSDFDKPGSPISLNINLNTYVMGQARVDVSLEFPYQTTFNDFWYNASSEPLDLTTLNPLTENVLGISILRGKGRVEQSFISGTGKNTTGTMTFRYKKLKLNMYNRKKAQQNTGIFSGVTRFLINDLLILKNNPRFARKPRTGYIYFARDDEKSIVNYVWKSLLSGMLSSLGINNREQRQLKKQMKNN